MESIEERALKKFPIDLDFSNPFCQDETSPKEDYNKEKRDLYIQGATDQKNIDIEKACKLWHKNILKAQITEEEFRQAMEEKI